MRLSSVVSATALFMGLFTAFGPASYAKNLKLYDGPERPASELVTLAVNGDSFLMSLYIQVNGKWARAYNGAQVLPGTYHLSVTSPCGILAQYPPANPPVGF
jgi:hypothetical protein